jgi:uncharacterized membrane protein
MYLLLLIAGVLLWAYSHLMKRVTPGFRAGLGENTGKLVVTVLSIVAIVMMVKGYRGADVVVLWSPPAFLTHVNNLLMLVAVYLVNLGYSRGVVRTKIRHPMLTAVKTWAIAHLLVNGDLGSVILFGGILAWAVLDLILTNRMQREWVPPAAGAVANDAIYAGVALAVFGVVAWVHNWFGYWPFG